MSIYWILVAVPKLHVELTFRLAGIIFHIRHSGGHPRRHHRFQSGRILADRGRGRVDGGSGG